MICPYCGERKFTVHVPIILTARIDEYGDIYANNVSMEYIDTTIDTSDTDKMVIKCDNCNHQIYARRKAGNRKFIIDHSYYLYDELRERAPKHLTSSLTEEEHS